MAELMRGLEQIPWLYDALMAWMDAAGLVRWRRWLAQGAHGRTLEVGCGTGRNLPLYRERPAVVAVDPERTALLRARARAPRALLVCARAEQLPFRGGAFLTAASCLVFCSVADAAAGLSELRRVLAADGSLRMIEHVRRPGWRGLVQDRIQPAWTWASGGCRPNRDTEGAVRKAGFTIDAAGYRARGDMRRFVATP